MYMQTPAPWQPPALPAVPLMQSTGAEAESAAALFPCRDTQKEEEKLRTGTTGCTPGLIRPCLQIARQLESIKKKLPKELLLWIFSFLDHLALYRCAQVSRAWNVLALDDSKLTQLMSRGLLRAR